MQKKSNLSFRRAIASLMMCVFAVGFAFAQQTVSGVVVDKTNEPIIGASVMVKGTTVGTITNYDGEYTLTIPNDAKLLVFSYIGMKTKEVAAKGGILNVILEDATQDLDEVVVVGYGVQKKRDLTGSVSSIGEKALKDIPVTTAAEAITGRMAGVQVTTTEGSPDAEISIRVRGGGSISQDNSPLFIVDGFPVASISNIPPSDIQSIDVLKDASSTAIYGARGANGVVIVTTKSGKEGKVSVNFNSYIGAKSNVRNLAVLSPYEYVMYQYELDPGSSTFQNYYGVYDDLEIYKSVQGTNWQDEVFGQTAIQQYYNVGISGGTKQTKYNLSLTRNDEGSIMIGSGFERNNLNFKLNTEISKTVSLDFATRMSYTIIDGAGVSSGSGSTTRLRNAVKYAPTKGLREFSNDLDDDDELNSPESTSLLFDPVESTLDEYKKQKRFASNYNEAINWKIRKDLTYRGEVGYDFGFNRTDRVWGPSTSQSKNLGGLPVANIYNYESQSWRVANTLTYNKNNFIPNHNLNVMIGQEVVSKTWKSVENESRYFMDGMKPADILAMMNLGTPIPTVSKEGQPDNLTSFFGRVNYGLLDRYLLSVTFRADGSSKFAKGNQWGYFPSAAFAWRINDEAFMQGSEDWLSNLKLRLSYGAAGNNRISDGLWKMTWNSSSENKPYYPNETESSQLIPGTTLSNPDLKWETTVTRNVGVDYGFFNGRLSGTVDVYWNTTKDLLIEAPLPASTGYVKQLRNMGQTSNRGIELALEGVIYENKNFSLSASANIAFNRNKVDKFSNGDQNWKTYSSGWNGSASPTEDFIVREGQPVGQMYGYVTDGMYSFDDFTFNTTTKKWDINPGVADNSSLISPANSFYGPGALKFKDLNGDGKIDDNDKTVIGNALPKHTGGFNIMSRYKNFDLSLFFNWSYGNDVYNANKLDYSSYLLSRKYQNLQGDMSLANRFTTVDPLTGHNIYYGANANPQRLQELNEGKTLWMPLHTTTPFHSWAVEDGSFLRLNNVTIGYTLPTKWTKKFLCQNLRVYFTGYNLWTITGYSGFDPEVDTRRSTPLTPSVDYSAYPKSRSYIGGVNVTF